VRPAWTIVEVETREQMQNAITDRTAMIGVVRGVERDPQPAVMQADELVALGKKSRRAGARGRGRRAAAALRA
jgi:hypothetical protein